MKSILTNEKYKGSALLQKRFTVDFLTKKSKVNEGEVPQYYIEESHPAIIVPEEFELVQAELLRRQNLRRQYNGKSVFAARLVCGDCGNFFGAKVWHSNSKYRQVIWQCNHKFQGVCKCQTPHLQESVIQQPATIVYQIPAASHLVRSMLFESPESVLVLPTALLAVPAGRFLVSAAV